MAYYNFYRPPSNGIYRTNKKIIGGNNIGNRTRPFAYTFRVNENEKNLIDKAISASGLDRFDFRGVK